MRPKSTAQDLPPRMLRRSRVLVSGKVWQAYYYNGRSPSGARLEIPLGQDLNEAKRLWAQLEAKPAPQSTNTMAGIFARYTREVVPTKAPRTQGENMAALRNLGAVFGTAPIDSITPQHVAQYRDKRSAKVSANRELALLSHVYNKAREWGYTTKDNPVRGVQKNKEPPRSFYADAAIWAAVQHHASPELLAAMQLAYLTGQRTADVLKMRHTDIESGMLCVRQNKTTKALRIRLHIDGQATQLGSLIASLSHNTSTTHAAGLPPSPYLLHTPQGQPLSYTMLRNRFDAARAAAVATAAATDKALAKRLAQFQFRDIRAKAASEIDQLSHASALLGHQGQKLTHGTYRRAGEVVNPTR